MRGWGVDELAKRADIEPDSVRYYERGRATPQPAALARLAAALGVATVDLAPLGAQPTLHELRWHAGLRVIDLAARVGLSRSALSEQVRGRARITCPETWAAALSTPAVQVTPDLVLSAWQATRDARHHLPPVAASETTPAPPRSADLAASGATSADGPIFAAFLDEEADGAAMRENITAALANVQAAEQRLNDAVAAARANGQSWDDIGKILGVTRQAAWQRFAHRTSADVNGGPADV